MNDNNSKEVRNDKLQEILELSLLYDFYGELLGDHKKQIFEDYILNDLSLSEIADEAGISRQGVYDIVKRCSKKLKEYEEKLCLVKKFQTTKDKINQIKEISELIRVTNDVKRVIEIEQISEEILNDL
ncbi:MAG: DNA-binding protein [Lachnospiraceae bacterium]|nr:DNA-binding protein [Lachnospiraceae bacterium]